MGLDEYVELLSEFPDTEIGFGRSCFTGYGNLLTLVGVRKVLVVTGRDAGGRNERWERFLALCRHYPVSFIRCPEVEPEPNVSCVNRLVEAFREERPDGVAALGGGSVMDAAKAAWLVFQAGGRVEDYFGVNAFSDSNSGKTLKRVICFPTTSGTGSEVTPYSNIVENETGLKRLIVEDQIIPDYSFVYPEFTLSCPKELTLSVAFDALSHAIEGLLNFREDDRHPHANAWALACVRLIVENLPQALRNGGDFSARERLAIASCLGGMVIRFKSTGIPHLCSFSWAGKIPHGIACSVVLPHAWGYYLAAGAVAERTKELRGIFGEGDESSEAVIRGYRDFMETCGLPMALKDVSGLSEEVVMAAAEAASANEMKLKRAPRPVPTSSARVVLGDILQNAWRGDWSEIGE